MISNHSSVQIGECVLCSDQFDPFNRQPLTMDMVQPATELKQQIDLWLADVRKRQEWRHVACDVYNCRTVICCVVYGLQRTEAYQPAPLPDLDPLTPTVVMRVQL